MVNRFNNWQYPNLEEGKLTRYNWVVQHIDGLKLGYRTDIGAFSYVNAKNGVVLEDNVQLGSHCSIYSISTIDNKTGSVILKKNCCVGSHSTVMPNVTIGENTIVGANSFVNKSLPSNCIAVGCPVKIIKIKNKRGRWVNPRVEQIRNYGSGIMDQGINALKKLFFWAKRMIIIRKKQ